MQSNGQALALDADAVGRGRIRVIGDPGDDVAEGERRRMHAFDAVRGAAAAWLKGQATIRRARALLRR